MTGQSHPTQPWPVAAPPPGFRPAPNQPPGFPSGPWAPPAAHAHPTPGPWVPAAGQFAGPGLFPPAQAPGRFPPAQFPPAQFPPAQFPPPGFRPAPNQPPGFPSGPWAPPAAHAHPTPGPWVPAAGQFAGPGLFPPAQFPPAPRSAGQEFGGPWPSPGPGHWPGHPMPNPAPHPVRPVAPGRRRGPVAMVSALLLVLLVVGAGAWVVSAGHTPATTVGASNGSPLAAPSSPGPLPTNPLDGGGFCQVARDTVARQGAALNDPNVDLTAMLAEARATNQRLAAAAPAELRADFAVFQQVSDQMVAALNGGDPQALQGVATPRFLAAVEHITTYAKTRCGIQLDALTPPGLGG